MTDLPAGSSAPGAPASPHAELDRGWWGEPDPVEVFAAGLELSLRQLRVEIAGLRAERDGLRLEVEGLRAKLLVAQEQLTQRDSLSDTVRQLQAAVGRLTLGATAPPAEADVVVDPPAPAAAAPPVEHAAPSEPSALDQLKAMGLWPPRPAPTTPEPEQRDDETRAPRVEVERQEERELDDVDDIIIVGPAPPKGRPRRALTAAMLVLGVVVIVSVLLVAVGPRLLPYRTYFVRSGSMEPTIPTGALVVLTKTDSSTVVPGDIITFKNPLDRTVLITHRIVDVETDLQGRAFITKGDANAQPDPWRVPAIGTSWKHSFDVPILGYVFGFLAAPEIRIALIVMPVLVLGVLGLLDIWRRRDDDL